MTQFAITARVGGVDRSSAPLTVDFSCLGLDRDDVQLTAIEPSDNCVRVSLRVGSSAQWRTIERAHVSVGAADLRGRITTFTEVGRTPVLTATAGAGTNEFTFDVLPGYVDPTPDSRQLEFTFVVIGDVLLLDPQP